MIEKICPSCGKSFKVAPHHVSQVHCSRKCASWVLATLPGDESDAISSIELSNRAGKPAKDGRVLLKRLFDGGKVNRKPAPYANVRYLWWRSA